MKIQAPLEQAPDSLCPLFQYMPPTLLQSLAFSSPLTLSQNLFSPINYVALKLGGKPILCTPSYKAKHMERRQNIYIMKNQKQFKFQVLFNKYCVVF